MEPDPDRETLQPIEWWPAGRFAGRCNVVESSHIDSEGHTHIDRKRIEVPDDTVICDACNADISEFPVCVVGTRALCRDCRERWHICPGDTEFFESSAYTCDLEGPKPGINYGGRKP